MGKEIFMTKKTSRKSGRAVEYQCPMWAKGVVVGVSMAAILCMIIALVTSIYLLHR